MLSLNTVWKKNRARLSEFLGGKKNRVIELEMV